MTERPRSSISDISGQKDARTGYYTIGLLFTIVLIGISVWLEPAEKGYGTHTQLGLPECTFKQMTGVPGPSCGMTTSFAYMTAGNVVEAMRSNLFGVCLFFLFLLGGIEAFLNLFVTRVSLLSWMVQITSLRYLFVLFVFWLLSWILKLHVLAGNV